MECKHKKDDSKYIYDLGTETIILCKFCNCILAGEIIKQLAIEHFSKDIANDK